VVLQESGIGSLYGDALIDDFVFDPQGYSMNGLRERGYFTVNAHTTSPHLTSAILASHSCSVVFDVEQIHITPQPNCSYASFEVRQPPSSLPIIKSLTALLFYSQTNIPPKGLLLFAIPSPLPVSTDGCAVRRIT
jgi:hypothetical protein